MKMLATSSASTRKSDNIKDLTKVTIIELKNLKASQEKTLNDKFIVSHLPDKGARLQKSLEAVLAEIARRESIVDDIAEQVARMQLKSKMIALEWQDAETFNPTADILDSDDEDNADELRIIAKGTMHERKTRVLPPEPTLITPEDLEEIESFHSCDSEILNGAGDVAETNEAATTAQLIEVDVSDKKLEKMLQKLVIEKKTESMLEDNPHARYLMEKMSKSAERPQREKFKPYKTTISNVHDPAKDRSRKRGDKWENTAATVPPLKSNGVVEITLEESVIKQIEYAETCKRLMLEEAKARLAERSVLLNKDKLELPDPKLLESSTAFTKYRESSIEGVLSIRERIEEDNIEGDSDIES